jgi:tetratricopeptide (TPR) repeat protein
VSFKQNDRWTKAVIIIVLAISAGTAIGIFVLPLFFSQKKTIAATSVGMAASNDLGHPIFLIPEEGTDKIDQEILTLQKRIAQATKSEPLIDQLGWKFVSKARLSNDPGYYKLAEQCAIYLSSKNGNAPDALLLRGHIFHALHRFKDAEEVARKLLVLRQSELDYALLGDSLMEQGRLDEAVDVYQKMIDIKPCLQTYTRVAYIRWLKGDLQGARDVMADAVGAGSFRDTEPLSWSYSRLAIYDLQSGNPELSLQEINTALRLTPNYALALLVRGKILLSEGRNKEAIEALRAAAEANPLPEYQWTLADALRADGNIQEALTQEKKIMQKGAVGDPRTFALFLATRREDSDLAVTLAGAELQNRRDVFTYDSLAWAQNACGRPIEAQANMQRALAEGTQDARLYYHAGVIAAATNKPKDAIQWLVKADAIKQMLLPSERDGLLREISAVQSADARLSTNNQ